MRLGFKRSLIVGVAVVVLLAVLAPVALAANGPVHVWGMTQGKYYKGVRALSGATVTVAEDPAATPGISGANGLFDMWATLDLAPLYTGSCTVNASCDHFDDATPVSADVAANPGPPVVAGATGAVVLQLLVHNSAFKGIVKNMATGKGLKGVTVKLGNKTVKTKANGRYSISAGLWPGTTNNKLTFSKKGFHKVTKTVSARPDLSAKTINVSMHK